MTAQATSTSTFKQFLRARNGLPLTRPYTPQLIGSACESWEYENVPNTG